MSLQQASEVADLREKLYRLYVEVKSAKANSDLPVEVRLFLEDVRRKLGAAKDAVEDAANGEYKPDPNITESDL